MNDKSIEQTYKKVLEQTPGSAYRAGHRPDDAFTQLWSDVVVLKTVDSFKGRNNESAMPSPFVDYSQVQVLTQS